MPEPGAYPAIVVAAFNRPAPLSRLLASLAAGHYPEAEIPLHISVDGGGNPRVAEIAQAFAWPHGPKAVDLQPRRLGLRQHILQCGDLSQQYGAIILLEDDLLVSPWYYAYAREALAFYAGQPGIAGISLYKYAVAESCFLPFAPLEEGTDSWFMQLPASWGQAWTAAQWQGFRAWLAEAEPRFQAASPDPALPTYMHSWSDQSWKKRFAAYLIDTHQYFVYPQVSLSTNFGAPGTHADTIGLYQVALLQGAKEWRFAPLPTSNSVYDAWFELLPDRLQRLCPALAAYDLVVDIYGQKPAGAAGWWLTSRSGGTAERSYALALTPAPLNVIQEVPGEGISLVRGTEVPMEPASAQQWALRAGGAHLGPVLDRLPRFSLVVPWTGTAAVASIRSGLDQGYPHTEVVVAIAGGMPEGFPEEFRDAERVRLAMMPEGTSLPALVQAGLERAGGTHLCWLPGGATLAPTALQELGEVLYQFPEIDWLVSLPEGADPEDLRAVAAQRWNLGRAARTPADRLLAAMSPERVVFRRYLWEQQPHSSTMHMWEAFFRNCAPHVVARSLSHPAPDPLPAETTDVPRISGTSARAKAARFTGPFYRKNMRILRQLHLWLADYPPVIRYNAADTNWFRSEF